MVKVKAATMIDSKTLVSIGRIFLQLLLDFESSSLVLCLPKIVEIMDVDVPKQASSTATQTRSLDNDRHRHRHNNLSKRKHK